MQDGTDLGITVSWGSTTFVKTDLEHVILWMGTETGGARITSGTMVQTYLSFPDPDTPGNSQTFSCTAKYVADEVTASMYGVRNYYGGLSFAVGESTDGTYSEINEADYDPDGPWQNHDVDPANSYKSLYNVDTGVGIQSCQASRIISSGDDYKSQMEIKSEMLMFTFELLD